MGQTSVDRDPEIGLYEGGMSHWSRVVPALGVMLLLAAAVNSALTFAANGVLLEAVLDLFLVGSLGAVLLYLGIWLPNTTLGPEFYPRILLWVVGGVVVMEIVLGLRILHPGVNVQFTFGTQAVFLAIGSIAGLGIGVHEAQALVHARRLRDQNEELKRTEEQLEEAVTQLEASNEQLEQFAHAAAHDLQEPLRMVTSYLDLIESQYGEALDEDGEEFLEFAADGAERMGATIDGLLEYSRVDARGEGLGPVDLDAVLDDVLTDLQVTVEESDAEITRDPLPVVRGDGGQLRQVVQNLLCNAIEYSGDERPRIHVSATREGDSVTVSVRDDGTGIDADDTDRIFDVFERLRADDDGRGSGIGLALCDRVVDRHGGDIWVESEPGEGSTFSFTLRPE